VELDALGVAALAAAEDLDHLVDRVGGHAPVGREFAAIDADDATGRDLDRMTTRQVGGSFAARRTHQRA
jgi:hypothetical protein